MSVRDFINLDLLSEPLNWGIVLAVLMLVGVLLTVGAEAVGGGCNCRKEASD